MILHLTDDRLDDEGRVVGLVFYHDGIRNICAIVQWGLNDAPRSRIAVSFNTNYASYEAIPLSETERYTMVDMSAEQIIDFVAERATNSSIANFLQTATIERS